MAFALKQNGLVHELFAERPDFGAAVEIVEVRPEVRIGWVFNADGTITAPGEAVVDITPSEIAHFSLEMVRYTVDHYLDHDLPVPQALKDYRIILRASLESNEAPKGGWPEMPKKPSFD